MAETELLKKDLFGEISLRHDAGRAVIVRDTSTASLWVRWLARMLMRRFLASAALAASVGCSASSTMLSIV